MAQADKYAELAITADRYNPAGGYSSIILIFFCIVFNDVSQESGALLMPSVYSNSQKTLTCTILPLVAHNRLSCLATTVKSRRVYHV